MILYLGLLQGHLQLIDGHFLQFIPNDTECQIRAIVLLLGITKIILVSILTCLHQQQ